MGVGSIVRALITRRAWESHTPQRLSASCPPPAALAHTALSRDGTQPHVDQIDRETLMQIQENLDINDDGKVTKAHTGTAPCTAHPSKPLRHAAAVGGRLCRCAP